MGSEEEVVGAEADVVGSEDEVVGLGPTAAGNLSGVDVEDRPVEGVDDDEGVDPDLGSSFFFLSSSLIFKFDLSFFEFGKDGKLFEF